MLVIKNLSKQFGTIQAVDDLNLTLNAGEMLGLLGHNGAGKTTTFRMILNIQSITSGSITLDGENIEIRNSSKIGFLTEERSLIATHKVKDQLLFFAKLKGMNAKLASSEIDYWLEKFELSEFANKNSKELSKGNQQKVQFISSFIHKPKLLILDEPFSGLDPINIELFKNVILELKQNGCAIIFSSHRLDHVERFCDDIIVLKHGKTVMQGNIDDLKREASIFKVTLRGTIDEEKLRAYDFVTSIELHDGMYSFYINDYNHVNELSNLIKEGTNITHFNVQLPTLEELFVEKVGGLHV